MRKYFHFARTHAFHVLPVVALLLVAGCGSREERAQGYYERGMSLLEKGDLAKARVELRNAIQLKGDMIAAWRGMVKLEDRAQAPQAALAALRRVIELDPKDVEAEVRLGKFLFVGGSLDEALKVVNTAIEVDGKNTAALALRAAIFLRLNDGKQAVQEAHKVLGIDPGNVEAMIILAAERFSRDDTKGALDILDDVPAAHKDDLSVLFLKIRIYEKVRDLPKIEAVLRKLIELNPKEQTFQRELVKFLFANKRIDDAEKEMRALVAVNPGDSKTILELVSFLQTARGPATARAELSERIKAGGRVFPYQVATAELDYSLGNYAEAIKQLEDMRAGVKDPADLLVLRTRLAEFQLRRNNIPAAEALIAEILRVDGRNTNALKMRASIRIEAGKLEDAIADLRQALNDQPRSPELLALLALAYERNGQIELADKQLADAMRASGFAVNYGLNYIAFLQRRGLATHAENVLNELATRNPNNTQIMAALARTKLEHQDRVAAQEIADVIRRIGPQGAVADQISAAALAGQKKYDESLTLLRGAYDANPSATQPMYTLVRGYIQAQQADKAQEFLESVLKVNPKNPDAYVLLGLTQLVKSAPDLAVKSFNAAIEQEPKNPVGYGALASHYVRQKDFDAAQKVVQAGLQQQPSALGLRLILANLFEQKGDTDAAIAEYERLYEEQPGSMVVANNLASLLSDWRSDQASRDRAFTVAAQLAKSQIPQFKDTLGWVLYLRGDYRNALPLLEEAIEALPTNALARYHLGMTYVALGEMAKGSEQLKKALELVPNESALKKKIAAAIK